MSKKNSPEAKAARRAEREAQRAEEERERQEEAEHDATIARGICHHCGKPLAEHEPLAHCADCEEALEANRAGWCSECQRFSLASACKWNTEDIDGDGLADLLCPECARGRWCCEFYEDDSPALDGVTITQADIARCTVAGHQHDIADCVAPGHWAPAA